VVEGVVLGSFDLPVQGLEIRAGIHREDCSDPTRTVVPVTEDGTVRTGEDGTFSGTFQFLFTGPVTVACTSVLVVDPVAGSILADSTIAEPTLWSYPATDTIRVEFRLEPAEGEPEDPDDDEDDGEDGGGDGGGDGDGGN
jgi:hypothetical protein